MRYPKRDIRGFSLVEVMAASLVALLLFGVVMRLFGVGVKSVTLSHRHLNAVQVAHIVIEHIENDVRSLVVRDGQIPSWLAHPGHHVGISFHTCRSDQGSGGVYRGQAVSYGLEAIPNASYFCLRRTGKTLHHLTLESLTFSVIHKSTGATGTQDDTTVFLHTVVVALDSTLSTTFTLESLTALESLTLRIRNPRWRPSGAQWIRLPPQAQ